MSLSLPQLVVEIQSPSLRTSWKVPADLIQMPSSSIVLLVTKAVLPTDESQRLPLLGDALEVVPDIADASSPIIDPLPVPVALDNGSALIEQDHDIIVRLAVSHSIVKYWLYLRMFWHCRGGDDRQVRSKIAAIEEIADKGPGVLQRWTRVKKGMALMAMLLNARQTLVALLECRVSSLFDKLIYLHVRHQQEPMISHLVQQVKAAGVSNVTTGWMSKACQSRELDDLPPPSPRQDEHDGDGHKEDESSEDDDKDDQDGVSILERPAGISARQPSARHRTAPQMPIFSTTPTAITRSKRKPASQTRASPPIKRRGPSRPRVPRVADSDEEDAAETQDETEYKSTASSSSSPSQGTSAIAAPEGHYRSRHSEPRPPSLSLSLAGQLHLALVEMHSMPVLTYYHRLLLEYPDQVDVAAPFSYTSQEMYREMMRHRLEDQCHARVLLYDRDFLVQRSDCLTRLPALTVSRQPEDSSTSEPVLSCTMNALEMCTNKASKVWLFFPDLEVGDEDDRSSNSRKALAVYGQFYPHLASQSPHAEHGDSSAAADGNASFGTSSSSSSGHTTTLWDAEGGQLLSIPARLLLQAGVRVLLVVQRAGETVSMPGSSPSRYDSPCAHMVHTLPSPVVLSVAGNYCSTQHLLDHIEYQWERTSSGRATIAQPADKMETVAVEYPTDVFPVGFPAPASLIKPTTSWLRRRYQVMSEDSVHQRQAWASELDSPHQMLYLLNRQLDWAISERSGAPSPGVIQSLARLLHETPNPEGRARVLTLLTKAIAMSTIAAQLPVFHSCNLAFGCGTGSLPCLARLCIQGNDGDTGPIFQFSAVAHRRPLLFVRIVDGHVLTKQQAFAQAQLDAWHQGELCRYNVTRPGADASSSTSPTATQTVAEVAHTWRARSQYRQSRRSGRIAKGDLHPINTTYLQDICADQEHAKQRIVTELKGCLATELIDGGARQWCQVPTDVVHSPSFYLLRSSAVALSNQLAAAAITDVHNESQRLGFWHHLLPCEEAPAVLDTVKQQGTVDRAVLEDVELQEQVKGMYKLFTEMTKLASAADAWTEDDARALSPFVSTSYGELTQASVSKVLECMLSHGLQSDDVFLDVGSCYGRALSHVSLVTGIRLCGIEAVTARHTKAKESIAAWDAAQNNRADSRRRGGTVTDPLAASVELHQGDIMDHLSLLFAATHVMVFDARFQASTRIILQHVWKSLARSRLRMLFCTTRLQSERDSNVGDDNHRLELAAELSVTTGQNNFTMYAYRSRPAVLLNARAEDAVELAVFPGRRVGLRACRNVSVGERVLPLLAQPLAPGTWEKLRHQAADRRWQWMVRRDGGWMHVLNLARFVNSGCCPENNADNSGRTNARYLRVRDSVNERGTLYLECCKTISAGDEIIACGRHAQPWLNEQVEDDEDIWPWSCYLRTATVVPS